MSVTVHDWHRLFSLQLLLVMLVPLIFAMATTPLLPDALFIELAPSTSAYPCDACYTQRVVTMRRGDESIAIHAPRADAPLYFRVGRDVSYGDVRRVVLAARKAGYTRVTFVVRREELRDIDSGGHLRWMSHWE